MQKMSKAKIRMSRIPPKTTATTTNANNDASKEKHKRYRVYTNIHLQVFIRRMSFHPFTLALLKLHMYYELLYQRSLYIVNKMMVTYSRYS